MARRKSFLPTRESILQLWLANFAAKLQEHRTLFGFSTAQVALVVNSVAMFQWIVDVTNRIASDSQQFTAYKKALRFGPDNVPMDELPEFDLPNPPTDAAGTTIVPVSGLRNLIGSYAALIKNNSNYTEALGQDFGIIGPEENFEPNNYKTNISVDVFSNHREVNFVKGRADDVVVYAREAGSQAWNKLGTATISPFTDSRPAAQAVVMEYMAQGRIKNTTIGQESNIVQVTYSTTTLAA